jgi:hypothetical protein
MLQNKTTYVQPNVFMFIHFGKELSKLMNFIQDYMSLFKEDSIHLWMIYSIENILLSSCILSFEQSLM